MAKDKPYLINLCLSLLILLMHAVLFHISGLWLYISALIPILNHTWQKINLSESICACPFWPLTCGLLQVISDASCILLSLSLLNIDMLYLAFCRPFLILWPRCLSILALWGMSSGGKVLVLMVGISFHRKHCTHNTISIAICMHSAFSNCWHMFLSVVSEQISNAEVAGVHLNEGHSRDSHSPAAQVGLPTPASLAEILLSSRQLLMEQTGDCLTVCSWENMPHSFLISCSSFV